MIRGGPLTTDTGATAPPSAGGGEVAARPVLRRLFTPAGVVALMVLLICVPLPLGGGAFPADALSGLLVVVIGILALRDRLRLSPASAVLLGGGQRAAERRDHDEGHRALNEQRRRTDRRCCRS